MEQLLSTKLYIPPARPQLVSRPRLIDQLNQGLHRKLTLISAPAGFGKTTLVSEWIRAFGGGEASMSFAWLSLDEDDNDPTRFLAYFISALNNADGVAAGLGDGVQRMLQSPQPPPAEAVLTPLINEIAALPHRILFVLDDYHAIESPHVDDALNYLLENLPPHFHLVIATRVDPHLSLSRLRANDQLTEVRASDLRFSTAEAAEFLNQVMGLNLSEEDIAAIESRTEGWIVGLQLAAISMQRHPDATNFIKSFTGSHRLVLDYLIEEVLDQQSATVQTFLLKTAILEQLTGSLCDALTDQEDGQATLEMLDRANLFVIPLDVERRWYRYHHLFADLLRQKLNQTQSGIVSDLHSRASKWFEQNSLEEQAVDHALAAKDYERAAFLIEDQVESIWERGEHAKILEWMNMLPKKQLSSRPQIAIFYAWVQLEDGRVKAAEKSLKVVERAIHPVDSKSLGDDREHIVHLNTAHLESMNSVMRAMIGFRKADVSGIIKFANEALDSLPEEALSWRCIAAMALGDAQYIAGDMNAASEALSEAIRISKAAGNVYLMAYTSIKLAIILQSQGRLSQAQEICRELRTTLIASGLSKSTLIGLVHAEWGEILWDLNDIDNAYQLVSKGIELSKNEVDLTNLAWVNLVLVKVLYAKRDLTGAMETILKLEEIAGKSRVPVWIVSRIAAWKARIRLLEGNLDAAGQWLQERQLRVDDEILFVREIEYIVFARILILQGEEKNAVNLLQRMIEKAGANGRITRQIEMLLVMALALNAQGDGEKALVALSRSLSLAEKGGHVRLFVNEGPPMAHLLYEALARGIAPDYVQRLLATFPAPELEQVDLPQPRAHTSDLIEPLSDREIEVLQLLDKGLTNQEIATRLYLSLNTVKVHTRNIYAKLGAHNRMEAVVKARALGILSPA